MRQDTMVTIREYFHLQAASAEDFVEYKLPTYQCHLNSCCVSVMQHEITHLF